MPEYVPASSANRDAEIDAFLSGPPERWRPILEIWKRIAPRSDIMVGEDEDIDPKWWMLSGEEIDLWNKHFSHAELFDVLMGFEDFSVEEVEAELLAARRCYLAMSHAHAALEHIGVPSVLGTEWEGGVFFIKCQVMDAHIVIFMDKDGILAKTNGQCRQYKTLAGAVKAMLRKHVFPVLVPEQLAEMKRRVGEVCL